MTATITEQVQRQQLRDVGEVVKEAMRDAGHSYKSLAGKLGRSPAYVQQHVMPSPSQPLPSSKGREAISKALGKPPTWFGSLVDDAAKDARNGKAQNGKAQAVPLFSDGKTTRAPAKRAVATLKTPPRQAAPSAALSDMPAYEEPKMPDLPAHFGPVRVENAVLRTRMDALEEHLARLTEYLHKKLG